MVLGSEVGDGELVGGTVGGGFADRGSTISPVSWFTGNKAKGFAALGFGFGANPKASSAVTCRS